MRYIRQLSCASLAALLFTETPMIKGVDGRARNLGKAKYSYKYYGDDTSAGAGSYRSSDEDKNTIDVTTDGADSHFLTAIAAGNRAKRILESTRFKKASRNRKGVPSGKKKGNRRRYAYIIEPVKDEGSEYALEDKAWAPVHDYDYVYAYELEPTFPADFDEETPKYKKDSSRKGSKTFDKLSSKGKKNEKRSARDSSGDKNERQDTASNLISSVLGQDLQCDSAVGAMGLLLLINTMTTILKDVMGPKMPIIGRRKRSLYPGDSLDDSLTPLLSEPTMNSRRAFASTDERPEEPLRKLFRSSAIPPSTLENAMVNETLTSLAPALRWYGEYLVTPKKDVLNCASQALCHACRELTKKYKSDGSRLVRSLTGLLIGVLPDYHARDQAARAMEIGCTSAGLNPKCGLPIAACPTDQISAMIHPEATSSTTPTPEVTENEDGTTIASQTATQEANKDTVALT